MPFQELIADSEYKEAAMLCPKALWQTGPPGPSQAPSGEASAAPVEPPLPPPPPPQSPATAWLGGGCGGHASASAPSSTGGQTTADSLDTYVDTARTRISPTWWATGSPQQPGPF